MTSDQPPISDLPSAPVYLPTPNNPPWNGWVAIGVWLMSVVFVLALPIFFVTPYAASRGIEFSNQAIFRDFLFTDPTAVILQLAPIIIAHLLTLLLAWFVVTKANTYSFRETLGWRMNGFKVWHAVVLTCLFYLLTYGLTVLLGDVENEFDLLLKSSRSAVYLVAFFATFTAPLVEEVVYRGLLFSAFQRRFGATLAVVLTTLLFTAVHVPQYSMNNTPDYATVIALLSLSLTLTLLRTFSGNLLPCIVLHTVFNGIQSALLIAEPYLSSPDPLVEPSFFSLFK
jgi:membrane protease YdiL (CAAX protease family)